MLFYLHRALLESYSDSAHLATYGCQSCVVLYLFFIMLHIYFVTNFFIAVHVYINKNIQYHIISQCYYIIKLRLLYSIYYGDRMFVTRVQPAIFVLEQTTEEGE